MSNVPAGNEALMVNMVEAATQLFLGWRQNISCKARGQLNSRKPSCQEYAADAHSLPIDRHHMLMLGAKASETETVGDPTLAQKMGSYSEPVLGLFFDAYGWKTWWSMVLLGAPRFQQMATK